MNNTTLEQNKLQTKPFSFKIARAQQPLIESAQRWFTFKNDLLFNNFSFLAQVMML